MILLAQSLSRLSQPAPGWLIFALGFFFAVVFLWMWRMSGKK